MSNGQKTAAALIGAAAVAAAVWFFMGEERADDDDRPPIIVSSGSVDIDVEYPDETQNSKGEWNTVGGSRQWRHDHLGPAPKRLRLSVFNGTCPNGKPTKGDLKITVTDGTAVNEVTLSLNGQNVFLNPGDLNVTRDSSDPSHLVVGGANTWIQRIDPINPSGTQYCEFAQTSRPIIRIEQKQK